MTIANFTEDHIVMGGSVVADAKLSVKSDANTRTAHFETTGNNNMVANDFVLTMEGVESPADVGAGRFVGRHFSGSGWAPSTAPSYVRAVEAQTIRQAGTLGETWGMEIGVHSEVPGNGERGILGLYIACSHTGWLDNGYGHKGDVGVLVTGEDGFTYGFRHVDPDNRTVFETNERGDVLFLGRSNQPYLNFFSGGINENINPGNDAKITVISKNNIYAVDTGVGGGTEIIIPHTGFYEIFGSVYSRAPNTQAQIFLNGASVGWGAVGDSGSPIGITPLFRRFEQGEKISLRCVHGQFGGDKRYSHFSIRAIG